MAHIYIVLAVALIFTPSPSAPENTPKKFDLVCSRQRVEPPLRERIDLTNMTYCDDDTCSKQKLIKGISEDEILLEDETTAGDPQIYTHTVVNRRTGDLTWTFKVGNLGARSEKYTCHVADYTGPSSKRLF